ncbi:hypothetical protein ACFQV8_37295 [Pseudonocardia benzenivorans]
MGAARNDCAAPTQPTPESTAAPATTTATTARPRARSPPRTSTAASVTTSAPRAHTGVAKRYCSIQSGTSTPNATIPSPSGTSRTTTAVRTGVGRSSAAPTTTAPTSTPSQPAYETSSVTLPNPATVGRPCDFATAVVGSS